jgi:hypothetical protein
VTNADAHAVQFEGEDGFWLDADREIQEVSAGWRDAMMERGWSE